MIEDRIRSLSELPGENLRYIRDALLIDTRVIVTVERIVEEVLRVETWVAQNVLLVDR